MSYELNKKMAYEIGKYLWDVPIGNAMASNSWSMPGSSLGALFSNVKGTGGTGNVSSSDIVKAVKSSMSDPSEWENLGKSMLPKILKAQKSAKILQESFGNFVSFGLRCNEFAAAMIYLIKLNRNFETVAEIVRLGASTNKCHYMVVLDRDRNTSGVNSEISSDKSTWGAEHILMDPWGAKQRRVVLNWVKEGDATSVSGQSWFIKPSEFGNRVFSVCSWKLPQPKYIA